MESLVIVVHVIAALGITGLVLIQHGKGADMGASFGAGASQTVFGSMGSGNALTKSTTWLATIFFITSLVLALFAKQQAGQSIQSGSLIENADLLPAITTPVQQDIPALPAGVTESDIPQTEAANAAEQPLEAEASEVVEQNGAQDANPPASETEVENAGDDSQNAPGN